MPHARPIVLVAVATLLVGCASLQTPQQKLVAAERTIQAAADTTRILADARVLDGKPQVKQTIRIANDEARNAIAKARTYVAAGQSADAEFWISRVLVAAAEIAAAVADAKERP